MADVPDKAAATVKTGTKVKPSKPMTKAPSKQGAKAPQKKQEESKGSSFNIAGFIRETKNEMKKVTWPTRQELLTNTLVVIVAVVFSAALIWVIDLIFGKLLRLLLGV